MQVENMQCLLAFVFYGESAQFYWENSESIEMLVFVKYP